MSRMNRFFLQLIYFDFLYTDDDVWLHLCRSWSRGQNPQCPGFRYDSYIDDISLWIYPVSQTNPLSPRWCRSNSVEWNLRSVRWHRRTLLQLTLFRYLDSVFSPRNDKQGSVSPLVFFISFYSLHLSSPTLYVYTGGGWPILVIVRTFSWWSFYSGHLQWTHDRTILGL